MNQAGIQYYVAMQRLISSVKKDIDAQIMPIVKREAPNYLHQNPPYVKDAITIDRWGTEVPRAIALLRDKWLAITAKFAYDQLANRFVRTALKQADAKNKRSFGIDILQNSPQMEEYLQAATSQNAQLIESIPMQYLDQVSNIVLGNMRQGLLPSEIAKQLEHQFGVVKRRAKFIARDQTAKVNGEMTRLRQQDAGFEYFSWQDSHDSRVRHRHREIAQAETKYGVGVYKWSDLPTGDNGQKIYPGSDFQCRCTARAIRNSVVEKYQASKRINVK
jgi:SPP1 gp7 family putative phage head morphogenesis protein